MRVKIIVLMFATLVLCIYSKSALSDGKIFSTDLSDYSAVIKINSDGSSYQVIKYGRLAKGVLYKDIKSVAKANIKIPNLNNQWYPGPYDEELKYQKILVSIKQNTCTKLQFCYIVIPALCDMLPNKANDTKGQLFRCIMEIERDTEGKTQEELIAKYSSETTENFFHTPLNFFVDLSISLPFNKLIAAGEKDSDNDGVPDGVDNCKDYPNFSQEVDGEGNPVACPPAAAPAAITATDCAGFADQICTAETGYTKTADCAAETICPSAGYSKPAETTKTGEGEKTAAGDEGGGCSQLVPGSSAINVISLLCLAAAIVPIIARRRS